MKFVYVGTAPTTLAGGRPVAPGEELTLTTDQELANAYLTSRGLLVRVDTKEVAAKPAPKKTDSGEEGAH